MDCEKHCRYRRKGRQLSGRCGAGRSRALSSGCGAAITGSGKGLKVCGEGIYATRPRSGDLWQEGDTIRFTRSKDERTVYCFALTWPGKTLALKTVRSQPRSKITMLGYPEPLSWRYDAGSGLKIDLPESMAAEDKRPTEHAWGWTIQAR